MLRMVPSPEMFDGDEDGTGAAHSGREFRLSFDKLHDRFAQYCLAVHSWRAANRE
jgi:hypothetical protein